MRSLEIVGGILVVLAFILALIYHQEALEVFHAFLDFFR
jgi:hypothetical protein